MAEDAGEHVLIADQTVIARLAKLWKQLSIAPRPNFSRGKGLDTRACDAMDNNMVEFGGPGSIRIHSICKYLSAMNLSPPAAAPQRRRKPNPVQRQPEKRHSKREGLPRERHGALGRRPQHRRVDRCSNARDDGRSGHPLQVVQRVVVLARAFFKALVASLEGSR